MRKYFLSLVLCFFAAENAFADTIDRIKASNSFCDCDPRDGVECPSCSGWRPFCPDKNYSFLYNDWCYKKCPSGTYTFCGGKNCLEKCPQNTVLVGQECKCHKGEYCFYGECAHCSTNNAIWNEKTEECEKCDYHSHVNKEQNICECDKGYTLDTNGVCIRDCDENFFRAYGTCYPCTVEESFSSVEESECLKCSNRKYVNGECKLKKFFLF